MGKTQVVEPKLREGSQNFLQGQELPEGPDEFHPGFLVGEMDTDGNHRNPAYAFQPRVKSLLIAPKNGQGFDKMEAIENRKCVILATTGR
ncbi:hypothetical protein ADIS_0471 [Lunatimonas lonarensis]|uniref:Uncharacterized protein n=1 Tax=Lunatimonas lonarensis TaxID=1232681 RepID=R7ZYB6_9BACT|nr:hypothetical protein ADIS_0471 [Lunatimonas lonarensis]